MGVTPNCNFNATFKATVSRPVERVQGTAKSLWPGRQQQGWLVYSGSACTVRPHVCPHPFRDAATLMARQPARDPQRLNLALRSSAQRIGASGKFQHDAPVNCLLRIETVRVPANREKRENEAKMPMKIRLKQVENRYNTHTTSTCEDEYLLKACASRQEKLSFCNKNCAARYAHIAHPRIFFLRGKKKIARPCPSPRPGAHARAHPAEPRRELQGTQWRSRPPSPSPDLHRH